MARKLKTYITNLGFFELALAAPSMKAALEAWGMGHNAFHHGFARETDDPKIVAATMAKPGVVLRRPVGTTGAFAEHAELPRNWKIAPPKTAPVKPVSKPPPRPPKPAKKARDDKKETAARAAIISFEKAKARRERERDKEAEREAAREEKERAQRTREAEKAEAALARAQARHEEVMASIEKDREKLDRRAKLENDRWNSERDELKEILRDAQG
jgi:colicin import membrane protein